MKANPLRIIVGFSGASGAIYGQRLLDLLEQADCQIHLIVTKLAQQILLEELSITELTADALIGRATNLLTVHDNNNMFSPLASGSFGIDAMVICPCTSHSVAALAAGMADSLLLRSAYVTLKQRRPLVLVHRETPLTGVDLENMLKLTHAGAIISPASPAFYMTPQTISDLVDSVAGRILDLLGVDHDLPIRWAP